MTLDAFLGHFEHVRKLGKNWTMRCPAHDDRSRNTLHVALGAEGRRLVVCRAGCDLNAVMGAVKLKAKDLFDESTARRPDAPLRRIKGESKEYALLEVRRRAREVIASQTALYPLSDRIRARGRVVASIRKKATALGDTEPAWDLLLMATTLEEDVFALEAEQDALMVELRRR